MEKMDYRSKQNKHCTVTQEGILANVKETKRYSLRYILHVCIFEAFRARQHLRSLAPVMNDD